VKPTAPGNGIAISSSVVRTCARDNWSEKRSSKIASRPNSVSFAVSGFKFLLPSVLFASVPFELTVYVSY
jgi:hypothetical protein